MTKILFNETYPIFTLTLHKEQTPYNSVDALLDALQAHIDAHGIATYIGRFDHFSHTCSLADAEISTTIQDAKNILFCFGKELPNPLILAVRPRSIGVADMGESFVLSFLEAPNPVANEAMQSWCTALQH